MARRRSTKGCPFTFNGVQPKNGQIIYLQAPHDGAARALVLCDPETGKWSIDDMAVAEGKAVAPVPARSNGAAVNGGNGRELDAVAAPSLPKGTKPEHAGHDFYVDAEGFVRGPAGRILIDDLNGEDMIYDYRRAEARNRDTIVWADNSTGAFAGLNFCGPG